VDQKLGSAARDEFYSKVAARTPELMKAHWTKMMFTGRGQPPGRRLTKCNRVRTGVQEACRGESSVNLPL
jgi:hypothetical protein